MRANRIFAQRMDLNPSIGHMTRLMARWSCSTTLLSERRDGTGNLAPIAAVFPWYSAAARSGDFSCGVSAALRVLAQDVFKAAGVKDTQAPFFQRDGVAGGDAVFRPIR
jgi:hypothetical protein